MDELLGDLSTMHDALPGPAGAAGDAEAALPAEDTSEWSQPEAAAAAGSLGAAQPPTASQNAIKSLSKTTWPNYGNLVSQHAG